MPTKHPDVTEPLHNRLTELTDPSQPVLVQVRLKSPSLNDRRLIVSAVNELGGQVKRLAAATIYCYLPCAHIPTLANDELVSTIDLT
jgi:hypothetical protein